MIRAWQGLGYNRRALALHRAAQEIAANGWPDDLTLLPGVGPYTAAAVRNFALGEDVLPRDVNVERVERRTGHRFTGAAGQALMHRRHGVLGAHSSLRPLPARGRVPVEGTRDEPARKQSRFEGSFRQRRAAALRLIAAGPRMLASLDGEAVEALARDGLVVVEGELARLPA